MSALGSTRSIEKLIDRVVDEICQATRRAARSGATLDTTGLVEIRGRFAITEEGELVIHGSAEALVGGVPVNIGAGVERSHIETGSGDGDLLVRLEVHVTVGKDT